MGCLQVQCNVGDVGPPTPSKIHKVLSKEVDTEDNPIQCIRNTASTASTASIAGSGGTGGRGAAGAAGKTGVAGGTGSKGATGAKRSMVKGGSDPCSGMNSCGDDCTDGIHHDEESNDLLPTLTSLGKSLDKLILASAKGNPTSKTTTTKAGNAALGAGPHRAETDDMGAMEDMESNQIKDILKSMGVLHLDGLTTRARKSRNETEYAILKEAGVYIAQLKASDDNDENGPATDDDMRESEWKRKEVAQRIQKTLRPLSDKEIAILKEAGVEWVDISLLDHAAVATGAADGQGEGYAYGYSHEHGNGKKRDKHHGRHGKQKKNYDSHGRLVGCDTIKTVNTISTYNSSSSWYENGENNDNNSYAEKELVARLKDGWASSNITCGDCGMVLIYDSRLVVNGKNSSWYECVNCGVITAKRAMEMKQQQQRGEVVEEETEMRDDVDESHRYEEYGYDDEDERAMAERNDYSNHLSSDYQREYYAEEYQQQTYNHYANYSSNLNGSYTPSHVDYDSHFVEQQQKHHHQQHQQQLQQASWNRHTCQLCHESFVLDPNLSSGHQSLYCDSCVSSLLRPASAQYNNQFADPTSEYISPSSQYTTSSNQYNPSTSNPANQANEANNCPNRSPQDDEIAIQKELGKLLFSGWELRSLSCPACNLPLIAEGSDAPSICLRCG